MVVPSLTISKKKREMKKIFYILVSAIVALGAVACENEGLENINPNVGNGEGLSFVATIDAESRVALNDKVNSWELEDKVVINGYTFTCTDAEKGIFSCEKDGVRKDLIGKGEFTATYSNNGDGKVDSSAGAKGAVLTATGSFTETDGVVTANGFNFTLTSALLKFTTKGTFQDPFVLTNGDFTWSKKEVDTYYIAVEAGTTTLNYSIGGVTQKEAEITTEPGKIYNLGELTATEGTYGLVGQHQGWNITNVTCMYVYPLAGAPEKVIVYARFGVKLQDNGFKFAKTGLANWNTANTTFGAWTKTAGKEFFNYSTEMGVGAWYQVWGDNTGGQSQNIGVSDFNKTYDIYLTTGPDYTHNLHYTIVEHGTKVTYQF